MKYTATCLFGLEGLLGREIDALGYKRCETIDGRVTFEGDESAAPRANINLRFAERVYINMGTFPCTTFDALFEGARSLPWEEFISKDDAFPVSGHCIKSKLFSVPDCQKIVKKAVARRLGGKYGLEKLPETQTVYKIEFFIFKDSASLMIDTSGTALHKRGYRPETVCGASARNSCRCSCIIGASERECALLRSVLRLGNDCDRGGDDNEKCCPRNKPLLCGRALPRFFRKALARGERRGACK